MPKFVVEPLSRTHMLNVYPLVHLAVPTLDMCAWRRFVRLALDGRRGSRAGILVAKRAARRHICGLVCYRRETDLILGQVMQARNLIAIDMLDTQSIVLALVSSLRSLARANSCSSVHLMMPETEFAASGLPDMIAGLDRRSAFNHWVDVTFSANESLLKPSHEFAH
jgi:hypothetical protein